MPDATPIRLVLVDDDPLVRAGLQLILGGALDIEVVDEATDGQAAVEVVAQLRPDIVLMDVRMPRLDGVAATEQILARHGESVRVVVLTTFDTDDLVVRALRAGASGFLLKDTPPAQLVEAVRSVADGHPILSPQITATLIAQVSGSPVDDRGARAQRLLATLSERELEVARAVGEGLSNAEISRTLYLSVPTVKTHVSRLLDKLGCSNRVQVALLVHDAEQGR
ncbi:DNA-binding NarL/FixJ family response regulator [Barrientosiimonas humi]|uniref:DNA-binding NarL/FixJ family response regulator n=1 Tax=Barrientosiimonas humi TaxID=999931 RepID=A0A542XAL8_9MICO|nr:response regulator transcription factor [Barrientosiimonas humi]TQL32885.1 DNA-binding NarL/FixJ family response regulator [Barrientosiimonas humi]CAG7572875.1 Transcriptional regulatory protein DegU [Barrientosiimonas humi]